MTEPNKEDIEASTSATKEVAVEAGTGGTGGGHHGETGGGHHGGGGGGGGGEEDGHLLERLSLRHTHSLSKRNILPLIPSVSVRTPSQRSVVTGGGGDLHTAAAAKSVLRTNVDGVAGTMTAGNEEELLQIVQSFVLLQSHDGSAPPETIEAALASGFNGTTTDLDRYLELYGRNELPKPDVPSYLMLWISAFNDIMMILLVIAMIILYAVGDIVAATAILVILLIATNIGAYTEYTSNIAAAQLGDLPGKSIVKLPNHPNATDQGFVEISNVELLPGMILNLRTGDLVPADAIILQTLPNVDCSCMEALLTGESEPVSKRPYHHDVADDDPHAHTKREGQTRLFMGTEFRGEALVLVVETGARTQMGQIFQSMADENIEQSPLQKMVDKLILVLALLSIGASAINAAICVPTGNGIEPGETDPKWLVCTLNSVALTVAAVPENLPVALVIALASIIRNLATRGVIVKSLPAGEELSRLNYVFSDKTGTLTQNIMTARAVVTLQGHVALSPDFVGPEESTVLPVESALVHQVRILTAKAQNDVRSNPTGDACKKALPETINIPFERVLLEAASSKTKLARLAVTMNGQHYLAKVGSDWVLDGATGQAMAELDLAKYDANAVAPFDRAACMGMINTWAEDGYRVICIVAKPVDHLPEAIIEGQLGDFGGEGFVFLGCLVIQDPPREDVAENIRIIHGAGVVVSMITGDNPITGMSIAKQIGLAKDYSEEDLQMCLINAFELFHNVSEEDAKKEIIRRLHYSMSNKKGLIIGRVSPFQKRWFVEVAKAMGLIVAMTGDGANDAPALKAAHVGIAMGNGSDIAKAAGDMIMVNESFSGIVEAIRAGRLGFDNILKFLMFLLGTNISEVTIYLILTCANVVIVLDALNLLILNLLTDGFPAIALSQEKAEGDLMKRAPLRRDTSVLNKFTYMSIVVTNLGLLSSYFVVIFVCNTWYLNDIRGQDDGSVEDYSGGLAKTRMAFILLINIAELLLGFSHRAPDRSILSVGMFTGKYMNIAALSSIGAIIFMTHTPGLKGIMRTDYLDLKGYLLVAAAAFFPFILHETAKMCFFVPNNFSVYALYQYEYEVRDAAQVLKDAEGEGPDDEDGTGGGVETTKKTGQTTNGEA